MELTVETPNLTLANKTIASIKTRTRLIFSRMRDRIKSIKVTLQDINGPKGGSDKLCKIIVYGKGLSPIIVSDTQPDIHLAANLALNRANLSLQRKVKRRQSIMLQMPR